MHADDNKIIVLYKIDTGREGTIMLWHIFTYLKMSQKPNSIRPSKGI